MKLLKDVCLSCLLANCMYFRVGLFCNSHATMALQQYVISKQFTMIFDKYYYLSKTLYTKLIWHTVKVLKLRGYCKTRENTCD